MKVAVEEVTPLQVVFLRVFAGFIPVFIYSIYKKKFKLEHLASVRHFIVMSLLATALYFYGFVKGTEYLYSGVAGAVSGSIPIFSFFAAVIFLPNEKFSKKKLCGCLIGILGVVIIAKPFSGEIDSNLITGLLWMTLGSISLGLSFVYAKKFIIPLGIESSTLVAYQLGIASLLLFVITDFTSIQNIENNYIILLGTIFGLGFIGTGMAYIIYYYLVENLGAVKASSVAYLPPVVALILSAFIIGEPINIYDYVATIFIFSGVFLINSDKYKKKNP